MDEEKLTQIVNKAVKDALKEWESEVQYLHSPQGEGGKYYCSLRDCNGVYFQPKENLD